MATAADRRARLARRLAEPGLVVAPGVFDLISGRIADGMGFDALYMTGYGVCASQLGLPDAGLATMSEMVASVERLSDTCATPLIADADTGYGGLLNVAHTVRAYERAGAAALQIEDQVFPKKCGHTLGRRVIPLAEMIDKIAVAVDTRVDANLLIVARTDARTGHGLEAAIERGAAFAEAGADLVFVESPESAEEMAEICRRIDRPCLANMVDGGRTPILPHDELAALGYKVAIFPATGFLAAGRALADAFGALRATGSSAGINVQMVPFEDFNVLCGFEDIWAFDAKWARPTEESTER